MVNIYDKLRDEHGELVKGRTKLFIKSVDSDGSISEFNHGIAFVTEENGTQFIVDEWLVEQIGKLHFVGGSLSVKEGESIDPPAKSEKELQREELLRQLAELESQPTE